MLVESRRIAARTPGRGNDGTWIEADVAAGGSLDLPEIGVTLLLTDLYEDGRF